MDSIRTRKELEQDRDHRRRQALIEEMDSIFANHEQRVKEFLRTAATKTIAEQKVRKAESLQLQETDELVARVCHATGVKKKTLAQRDGDEPYE